MQEDIPTQVAPSTYSLLLVEAHDLHGLQSLNKQLVILLPGDLHVPRHQEAVAAEALQQEVL